MTDSAMAAILARTYLYSVTAFRPLAEEGEERLCEAAPCALSRSAHTSAPTPPDGSCALPEALYRLSLFTRPELAFRLGDRVEVTDGTGRVYHGRTSDSFCYPTHCVTVVAVSEVSELSASAGSEGYAVCSDVGQVSCETGEGCA